MIQCPNCKATLPDWQQTCQFCKSDTAKVARPAPREYTKSRAAFAVPVWVWVAYYAIATWWIIDALIGVGNMFATIADMKAKAAAATNDFDRLLNQPSLWNYLPVPIAAVTILFAIGLLVRNNTIRGIVNFFSFLKIVIGICGIVGTLIAGLVMGPWALVFLLGNVFTIFTAAMMIYLIGETDKVSY